jgi:hypothetical protein
MLYVNFITIIITTWHLDLFWFAALWYVLPTNWLLYAGLLGILHILFHGPNLCKEDIYK